MIQQFVANLKKRYERLIGDFLKFFRRCQAAGETLGIHAIEKLN